jgi:hypothetical protein
MKGSTLLCLMLLVYPLSALSTTLHLTNDLESHVAQGDRLTTVQVLDDSGALMDVNGLLVEMKNPLGGTTNVQFTRVSTGTYQATLPFTNPNQYYLTFIPDKPGFIFTNLEVGVYADPPSVSSLTDYIFPLCVLVLVGAGIVYLKNRM